MEEKSLKLNQETMDVLVANVIPTTKYFESQFNHMQYQINEIKENQKQFGEQVDKRFEQVDKRFEQVDKRFEQIDKRFEEVNSQFEQVDKNIIDLTTEIQQLSKNMEITIRDHIIDRDRHYDNKFNNLRMFNIAIIFGMTGIFAKLMNFI
jgi:methyl-accepting chemotaxis protein